ASIMAKRRVRASAASIVANRLLALMRLVPIGVRTALTHMIEAEPKPEEISAVDVRTRDRGWPVMISAA
ncbi:MAG: hypothetical protein ACRDKX_04740, partial [Solirubrobacterales bacterium]